MPWMNSQPMIQARCHGICCDHAPMDHSACFSFSRYYVTDPKSYGNPESRRPIENRTYGTLCLTSLSPKLVVAGRFRVIGLERNG